MSDRYSIVPGDVRVHKADVLALLAGNFAMLTAEPRYAKYYESNPFGAPLFVLARDNETNAYVGLASLFPTRLRVGGEPVAAALSADFVVDEAHRGFGPALALQRATLAMLEENGLECAFGCPNDFSDPVIARVGYAEVGTLSRFVKVLRGRHVIERRVRPRGLARMASALSSFTIDPLLSALSPERRRGRSGAFRVEKPAAFDERFAEVWEAVHAQHGAVVERSAEALNWKFDRTGVEGAASPYVIFALLSEAGRVVGYAVYEVAGDTRHILDIASLPSQAVVDALLSELIRDARAEGHGAVDLTHLGPVSPVPERLRAFGFRERPEHKRLRVYVPADAHTEVDLQARGSWYLNFGDNDL